MDSKLNSFKPSQKLNSLKPEPISEELFSAQTCCTILRMLLWSSELNVASWTPSETSVVLPPRGVFLHHVVAQCDLAWCLTMCLSTSPQPPVGKKIKKDQSSSSPTCASQLHSLSVWVHVCLYGMTKLTLILVWTN